MEATGLRETVHSRWAAAALFHSMLQHWLRLKVHLRSKKLKQQLSLLSCSSVAFGEKNWRERSVDLPGVTAIGCRP